MNDKTFGSDWWSVQDWRIPIALHRHCAQWPVEQTHIARSVA